MRIYNNAFTTQKKVLHTSIFCNEVNKAIVQCCYKAEIAWENAKRYLLPSKLGADLLGSMLGLQTVQFLSASFSVIYKQVEA